MKFDNALVLAHTQKGAYVLCQAPKYQINTGNLIVIETPEGDEYATAEAVANVYESSNDVYDLFIRYLETAITGKSEEPLPKVYALMFESVMKYPEEGKEG